MVKYGKSYEVRALEGESEVYRGGKLVGTFPQSGYEVRIFGLMTARAGTELAAHALAEVHLAVEHYNRRWVLTADEYAEHVSVLEESRFNLMKRFPFSLEEAATVQAYREKHFHIEASARENIRIQLMNGSPFEHVTWDPNPRRRPSDFPGLATTA